MKTPPGFSAGPVLEECKCSFPVNDRCWAPMTLSGVVALVLVDIGNVCFEE